MNSPRTQARTLAAVAVALAALIFLAPGLAATSAHAKSLPRYTGKLFDGTEIRGDELLGWHSAQTPPKLDDRPLLAEGNPIRWLRDHAVSPAGQPKAFVEFFSGDRLPGSVQSYGNGPEEEPRPGHFVVTPGISLRPPRQIDELLIRVVEKFVRRIVWQKRTHDRYQPATVFFRDGRSTKFRAIRFSETGALLLKQDGTQRVSFGELAELHMPETDFWQLYPDELAVLQAGESGLLLQVETVAGMTATGSLSRFTAYSWGNEKDPNRWIHGIQPAWSLDLLWVPNDTIWMRRLFRPHEVPLTRLTPSEPDLPPASRSKWAWQRNRNTRGGMLRSGGRDYGWGIGVHAYSELHFPLHPLVRSLTTGVGLDQVVGAGGCARSRITLADGQTASLFESPLLIGAANVVNTGALSIDPASAADAQSRLRLIVETAHDQRPRGADPFNIRDTVDWLEPTFLLDQDALSREVAGRVARQIPAWDDWTLATPSSVVWSHELVEFTECPGEFVRATAADGQPLLLSREMQLSDATRWLVIAANQTRSKDNRPRLQLRLDGETVFEGEVPYRERYRRSAPPIIVPLQPYISADSRPVRVELLQLPGSEIPVHWQAVRFDRQLPLLKPLLEDDFDHVRADAGGKFDIVDQPRYSGRRSLRLPAAARFRLDFAQPLAIRQHPGWGEFRHLRFAFRKQGGGRICVELDHLDSQRHPARLDAGLGEPAYDMASRVYDRNLNDQWIVITRDLYNDFGTFDIDSITLSAPDGEAVLFDHIYAARHPDDFQFIAAAPSNGTGGPGANHGTGSTSDADLRQQVAEPIVQRALPAVAKIDFGDGRVGAGTIISGDGYLLTAGHLVAAPGRDVSIQLADGKQLAGKTLGIDRRFDLGLIKIDSDDPLPHVEVDAAQSQPAQSQPTNQVFVAITRRPAAAGDVPPVHAICQVRRTTSDSIWTDFDVQPWLSGGPLLNQQGQVIGVLSYRSQFGGFVFGRLLALNSELGRLKGGEVFGKWLPHSGPLIGLRAETTADGCRVTAVVPDLPAAAAGVQVGDTITAIDGIAVTTVDQVQAALAEKNVGSAISLRHIRGGQTKQSTLQLEPRFP